MTVYGDRMTVETVEDTGRLITVDELAERLGVSRRTIERTRTVGADGRQYYLVLGSPVARISIGGRSRIRVPLPDVIAAITNAGMAS